MHYFGETITWKGIVCHSLLKIFGIIKMVSAVIFDMDGVMVDNFYIHLEAWNIFCERHRIDITEQSLRKHAFGRTNEELMPYFFRRPMSKEEIAMLENEKESIYREIYKGRVKLVEGLRVFLNQLQEARIEIALGTSAPSANARFILDETNVSGYFKVVVDGSMVSKGKPDPGRLPMWKVLPRNVQ